MKRNEQTPDKPRTIASAALAVVTSLLVMAPSSASADPAVIQRFPLTAFAFFIPCALDGAGETAVFPDGATEFFAMQHVETDAQGALHIAIEIMISGTGTGDTSGDTYRLLNQNTIALSLTSTTEVTTEQHFHVIGSGSGNDAMLTALVHVSVDAGGNLRASVDNGSAMCV